MQGCLVSDLRVVQLHAKATERVDGGEHREEESQMEEEGRESDGGGRRVRWRRREEHTIGLFTG